LRILFFSERLRSPYDEGIKNVTVELMWALAAKHQVLALTSSGVDDAELGIRNVSVNRLLLGVGLGRIVRSFRPQGIIYIPTACATLFSFVRAQVLRRYGRGAPLVLLTLQPRRYQSWQESLMGKLAPDRVVAQSKRTQSALQKMGCRTALLPPAVDTQRFCPVSLTEKALLRTKYGLPIDAKVLTHVGHLKGERNFSQFLALQGEGRYHTLVVGSTSTEQEEALKDTLRRAGASVIDTYVAHIEDIYRLSDVYLFLVEEETAAIELPLSVLEAMGCNIPVVCTPFGGLPDFFTAGHGLFYWDGQSALGALIQAAISTPCRTRSWVESRTWAAAAEELVHLSFAPLASTREPSVSVGGQHWGDNAAAE